MSKRGGPSRRDVLKTASAVAVTGGSKLTMLPVQGQRPVVMSAPEDKGYDAARFARLRERGRTTEYSGDDLKWIGMPIGGICAGMLYLGGDGRLWLWDIFNQPLTGRPNDGTNYAKPLVPSSPIECGFSIGWDDGHASLDSEGFEEVTFRGQYPMAEIRYESPRIPLTVSLEAFSPFVPHDEDASGLPGTFLTYRVTNTSNQAQTVRLAGVLENAVLKFSKPAEGGKRFNRSLRMDGWRGLRMDAEVRQVHAKFGTQPDMLVEDWSKGYRDWTATGTAFGSGPREAATMPGYMGDLGTTTKFYVCTHNTLQGENVNTADDHLGRLTRKPLRIQRRHLSFQIGGGNHAGTTCMNLLVDGKVVRTQAGSNSNKLAWKSWDVGEFVGRDVVLEIVDEQKGGWGQIAIGVIRQGDIPYVEPVRPDRLADWGSMALVVRDEPGEQNVLLEKLPGMSDPGDKTARLDQLLVGGVEASKRLEPGESHEFTFLITWYFPNPWRESLGSLEGIRELERWYAGQWTDAAEVARHGAENFDSLRRRTRAWRRAWYGGSLPHWLLERILIPADALATATCYRFTNDRFYGWEGNYCCAGTCTHVWGYAQSIGYLFPNLEKSLRTKVDFGLAWREDGGIDYRGEYARHVAHDGQCTVILRTLREHLNSRDNDFLKPIWPRVKKSIERLIADDKDLDGILEGAQYNTLDATWYGPMAWISSLYVAALTAGQRMADDMGDAKFASQCGDLAAKGSRRISEVLYNGEYFIHKPDPSHPEANSTNEGCHIDQVFGDSWLRQLGMDGRLDQKHVRSALRSLWKYSFCPDVGPYRRDMKVIQGGRWYAMPGEPGLLMCSWPRGGAERAVGKGGEAWAAGYFNECMHGFEYQVAAHMIAEDMVDEGLAIIRSIHDRYDGSKRNPYNEIECGDHYARSMASHGAYLTLCGFQYDGPKGIMGFAPKISAENFSCVWTGAEGWGTFTQKKLNGLWQAEITVIEGRMSLHELRLDWTPSGQLEAVLEGQVKSAVASPAQGSLILKFDEGVALRVGQTLGIRQG